MKKGQTKRGFDYRKFKDANGVACSIQISSAVRKDCLIWFGADKIGLQEFVAFRQPSAWKEVKLEQTIDRHHIANNRMHLTQTQVKKLLPILEKFVKTGEI